MARTAKTCRPLRSRYVSGDVQFAHNVCASRRHWKTDPRSLEWNVNRTRDLVSRERRSIEVCGECTSCGRAARIAASLLASADWTRAYCGWPATLSTSYGSLP